MALAEGERPSVQAREAIRLLGGMERFVRRGDRVVVLPNPQGRTPGTSTSAEMVGEVIRLCKKAGAASVTVSSCHGPGRWHFTGIVERVEQAGGTMKYPDSSKDWAAVAVPKGRARKRITILRDALESDLLINMPIFKHHEATRITGALKNLMGFNSDSGSFHQGERYLHQAIVDLASIIPPHLIVLDATTILIENGPFGPGRVIHPHRVYAGTDPVAIDALCCGLLRVPPAEVYHVQLAQLSGLGQIPPSEKDIKINIP